MAAPKHPKYLKKTVQQVMADARREIKAPSRGWKGMCQSFCRSMYGVPAWAGSASAAWNLIPRQHKHVGGSPSQAPRGAVLYFVNKSGRGSGHAMLAAGIKTHNKAIGTDYMRNNRVDYCPRTIPNWGNLKYVGWSPWTPFGELNVSD
jgi:hypothetical protein